MKQQTKQGAIGTLADETREAVKRINNAQSAIVLMANFPKSGDAYEKLEEAIKLLQANFREQGEKLKAAATGGA